MRRGQYQLLERVEQWAAFMVKHKDFKWRNGFELDQHTETVTKSLPTFLVYLPEDSGLSLYTPTNGRSVEETELAMLEIHKTLQRLHPEETLSNALKL